MQISEIKQNNSPFIRLINNGKEMDVPIHLVSHAVKDKYDNCNCFDTTSISVREKDRQINYFNENISYELHCEDESNYYVWENVAFRLLKNDEGLCVYSDKDAVIYQKHIEKINERKFKPKSIIGALAFVIVIGAASLFLYPGSKLNYKNLYNTVTGDAAKDNESTFAGVMNANNNEESKVEEVQDIQEEVIEETLPEEDESATEEASTASEFSYSSDNYKGKGVTYILIDKENYSPKIIMADEYESVSSLVQKGGGVIGINASAWIDNGNMNYTFVDGQWISSTKQYFKGDPLLYVEGVFSTIDHSVAKKNLIKKSNPEWVITGNNAVIFNTYSTNISNEESLNRSFIGQLNNGNYIVGVMENATYADMVEWARSVFAYDITILYNLDGGENCGLVINNEEIYSGNPVKNAIVF